MISSGANATIPLGDLALMVTMSPAFTVSGSSRPSFLNAPNFEEKNLPPVDRMTADGGSTSPLQQMNAIASPLPKPAPIASNTVGPRLLNVATPILPVVGSETIRLPVTGGISASTPSPGGP